ncbi:MAG: N-acetylmuramoyl-L-alanine amidase [Verrucomicrobiota bacterium]
MHPWTTSLILLGALSTAGLGAPKFKTVVIDPGHGGLDSGALWYGTQEKDVTLPVSKLLRDELKARGVANVVMTRDEDVILSLSERAAISNKQDRPIFVSIHFNANVDKSVVGVESYVMPNSDKSRELGETIGVKLKALGRRYLGVKTYNLKVLRETDHPAIVIEGGFLSNKGENWLVRTDDYQRKLAAAIAEGILAYRDSTPANEAPAKVMVAKTDPKPAPKTVEEPVSAPPTATPKPMPAPPKTVAKSNQFRIQFGAFSVSEYASNLCDDLKKKGIEVEIVKRQGQTRVFHRVVSTKTFPDSESASSWADQYVKSKVSSSYAVTQ